MREPLLERVRRARAPRRVVVGQDQPLAVAPRAGRRTRSCRRRPRSAASKLAYVLPGAIRSAPLCPTAARASAVLALASRAPVCRPVRVALPARSDRVRRSAGTAGPRARTRAPRSPAGRSTAERCIRGRTASMIATASSSATAEPAATGRSPASQHPSAFQMLPMPATLRWSSSASPIGRVWSSARSRAQEPLGRSNSRRQHVGPERGQPLVEPRPPLGHQLEQRAVELDHLVVAARGTRSRPAAPSGPSRSPGPYTPHTPTIPRCECSTRSPSKRRNRCLPCVSTLRTARPVSRSGQRSSACRGCGVQDLVGHPALEHRADPVGRVGDRVALGHYALRRQGGAGPLEAERDQRRPERRVSAGSPSTFSSASRLIRPARTCSTSATQRRLEPRIVGARRASGARARRAPGTASARRRPGPRRRRARASGGARRRAVGRAGHASAAPYGCAGSTAASTTGGASSAGSAAQPLDRAGQRELRAAEALDEVPAPGDPERLELRELGVDRREPARHALGQHLLAGQDPVALEQQLGERAPPRAPDRPRPRNSGAVSDQRPWTCAGRPPPRRRAANRPAVAPSVARARAGPGPASAAAPAAARTRRWSPRPPRPDPTAPPAAPRARGRRRRAGR